MKIQDPQVADSPLTDLIAAIEQELSLRGLEGVDAMYVLTTLPEEGPQSFRQRLCLWCDEMRLWMDALTAESYIARLTCVKEPLAMAA